MKLEVQNWNTAEPKCLNAYFDWRRPSGHFDWRLVRNCNEYSTRVTDPTGNLYYEEGDTYGLTGLQRAAGCLSNDFDATNMIECSQLPENMDNCTVPLTFNNNIPNPATRAWVRFVDGTTIIYTGGMADDADA